MNSYPSTARQNNYLRQILLLTFSLHSIPTKPNPMHFYLPLIVFNYLCRRCEAREEAGGVCLQLMEAAQEEEEEEAQEQLLNEGSFSPPSTRLRN